MCYLCGEEQPVNGLDAHIVKCKNNEIECDKCGELVAGDKFEGHRVKCDGPSDEPARFDRE